MKHLSVSTLALACVLIVGCGGGGNQVPAPSPTPTPVPVPSPAPARLAGIFRAPCPAPCTATVKGAFVAQAAITVNLSIPRTNHEAVLLPDGKVLVLGGSSDATGGSQLNTAETFDPATELPPVPTLGTMTHPHANFGAALLPNGTVFVIGDFPGSGGQAVDFDIYDPATGLFTSTMLPHPVQGHNIKIFPVVGSTGVSVIVLGGGANPVAIDITNPGSPQIKPLSYQLPGGVTISPLNPADVLCDQCAALQLSNGHLLITGGLLPNQTSSSTAIIDYDPIGAPAVLNKIGDLAIPRHAHAMVQQTDGTVRVYGGIRATTGGLIRLTDVEQIVLAGKPTPTFHVGDMAAPRAAMQSVALQNGTSVHTGGVDLTGVALNTQMLYVEPTNVSGLTADMITPRVHHTTTALSNGLVVVTGGADPNGTVTNTIELFDPQTSIYLQFTNTQPTVNTPITFKVVDATGADITAGTSFTTTPANVGSFSGAVYTTPAAPGRVTIHATNGANTASAVLTVVQ